tara:strand:- start:1934 stop:2428 length:495 start_codon:yes stop_codon:yes gene_type:complete
MRKKKFEVLREAIAMFDIKLMEWHQQKISKQEVLLYAIHPPWMTGDKVKQVIYQDFLASVTREEILKLFEIEAKDCEHAMRVVMAFTHPGTLNNDRTDGDVERCVNWMFDLKAKNMKTDAPNLAEQLCWKKGMMTSACYTLRNIYQYGRKDALQVLETHRIAES